jgi:hypothetical protein
LSALRRFIALKRSTKEICFRAIRSFFLTFYLGVNGFAFAQSPDTLSYPYRITGTIRDDDGNALAGVNIVSPGDGNMQVSGLDGKYFAYIYGPKTPVIFSCYKFSSVLYCPDSRTSVDIVLVRQKGSKSKKKKRYTCP